MNNRVYLLFHIRDSGELLLAGAYSSEARATEAVERLKTRSGFRQYPNDFEIQSYDLDADLWPDGFSLDEEVFSDDELPEKPPKGIN